MVLWYNMPVQIVKTSQFGVDAQYFENLPQGIRVGGLRVKSFDMNNINGIKLQSQCQFNELIYSGFIIHNNVSASSKFIMMLIMNIMIYLSIT